MRVTNSFLLAMIIFLGCFIPSISNNKVFAHGGSYGFAKVKADKHSIKVTLLIDTLSVAEFSGIDSNLDELIDEMELKSSYDHVIRPYIENGFSIKNNGRVLPMNHVGQSVPNLSLIQIDLLFKDTTKIGKVSIDYNLFFDRSENKHTNVATFETLDGKSFEFIFSKNQSTWSGTFGKAQGFFDTARQFIILGIGHIFTGYDHMLFIFALLLVKMKLRSIIAIVTSFTLAHSITLCLTAFDIVSLPNRLIEATIALSIVYVALENILVKNYKHRWAVTFLFGLIHGFGFAGVLQEIELPKNHELSALLTFNLGIEFGQLLIVLCTVPLLKKIANFTWWPRAIQLCSVLITLAGAYWFATRVFI